MSFNDTTLVDTHLSFLFEVFSSFKRWSTILLNFSSCIFIFIIILIYYKYDKNVKYFFNVTQMNKKIRNITFRIKNYLTSSNSTSDGSTSIPSFSGTSEDVFSYIF